MDNSLIVNDIRPLKLPVEIKGIFPIIPFIILVLLLGVAIAAFIYFRKQRCTKEEPVALLRPPEEIAMEELRMLLEAKLIEKGMIKEYYIRISDIVRKYIEGKYKIFALDKTTWELYQEMRLKKLQRAHVDKIRDFLEDCDLVKFAKYIPTHKEIELAYTSAKEIIKETSLSCKP